MFGIATGHIGRPFGSNVKFMSIYSTVVVFLGINWRQRGSSPPREGAPVTSTCSGTGQLESATSANQASTYSAVT